jgi:PAS domain S-box-containing protein
MSATPLPPQDGPTVLIVDDTPANLGVVVDSLEARGFRVVIAQDGEEGIERAVYVKPDLILLDVMMPGMDGFETCRRLKTSPRTRDIPVIFMTSLTDVEDKVTGFRVGGVDYVTKPLQIDEVMERVQTHLGLLAERETAQHRLRLLGYALDRVGETILLMGENSPRFLYVNESASRTLGYTRQELTGGMGVFDIDPGWTQAVWVEFWSRLVAQRTVTFESSHQTRRGRTFPVEVTGNYFEFGGQVYNVMICRDITERKQAEDALRWRTALFEAQVDAALDGILVVDREGKKILQNERMIELWKLPRNIAEDADDAQQLQFVTGQTVNPEQFAEKVAYLYAHPDEVSRDEIELVDGRVFDRYSSPVRDKFGQYYGRIWTFRDLTERRRLEEQIRQSQRMEAIGQLAGGIAHDFNNLLVVIQLQSSLLVDGTLGERETREGIHEIMAATERAANLTRQLLTFSRRDVRQPRDIDLGEVTGAMTKLLRRLLGEDIALETRYAPGEVIVNADPGMMEQVLMNLAINARDAMPNGGRLLVALEVMQLDESYVAEHPRSRPGRFARLTVRDNGTGIAPEHLHHIFEPFYTTKGAGKGTGLGLATVFGIVEQHHGWIEVATELGRGTAFRVFLPALNASLAESAALTASHALPTGRETILLVEDDPVVRRLASLALDRCGYRVIEAESASAALQRWQTLSEPVDLLLTDLIMPGGMSGRDLALELSTRQPGLRVLYTSGYSTEIVQRQLRLDPGCNFLQKPYPVSDLATTVRRCLDGPAAPGPSRS